MCLFLLNPPEPACQPTTGGLHHAASGKTCGACRCVPRYWQLHVPSGGPFFDLVYGEFGGDFLLVRRSLWDFQNDPGFPCAWDTVDIEDNGVVIDNTPRWSMAFVYPNDELPGDLDFGLRYHGRWVIWATHGGGGGYEYYPQSSQTVFRCLRPNTFSFDPDFTSDFPATITVAPCWP